MQRPAETAENQPNTRNRKANRRRWRYYYFLYYGRGQSVCHLPLSSAKRGFSVNRPALNVQNWGPNIHQSWLRSGTLNTLKKPVEFGFFNLPLFCVHHKTCVVQYSVKVFWVVQKFVKIRNFATLAFWKVFDATATRFLTKMKFSCGQVVRLFRSGQVRSVLGSWPHCYR